jgi:hypothetical protein
MFFDVDYIVTNKKTDAKYLSRCLKALKSWPAPVSDWYCSGVIDIKEDEPDAPLAQCDVCGCEKIRFIHVMEHDDFCIPLYVGCICAGVMEGDILKAKERDRLMKNRAKRKKNFMSKKWEVLRNGDYLLNYKYNRITIRKNGSAYSVKVNGQLKRETLNSILSAKYAAFEMIDPVSEVMAN